MEMTSSTVFPKAEEPMISRAPSVNPRGKSRAAVFALMATLFITTAIGARENGGARIESSAAGENGSVQQPAGPLPSPAQKYFTDVVLINQNGERMRFYADLMKDKVVIINSFFATCQGSCLPMNRNLEKVQQALGDRIGKDVNIISISVDPEVDTPANLKEYAKGLNARRGWYFLTGDRANVEFALKKLGHFVDKKEDHLNIIIIGNERTGLWKKAFALSKSDELIKVVESVVNDQGSGEKPTQK
jgi:protein SCO1/2